MQIFILLISDKKIRLNTTTACVEIGEMDTEMRTCLKSDLLTLSFAAPIFERMVGNMDKSFLTTYIWENLSRR